MTKKELIFKYRNLVSLGCRLHNLPSRLFRVRVKGKNNRIEAPCALLKQVSIHIAGNNNQVIIEDFSQIKNTKITICGNNNVVHLGKRTYLFEVEFFLEDDHNVIDLQEHNIIMGPSKFSTIEGTKIIFEKDSMCSSECNFRTGDSHCVLDLEGHRINESRDIILREHSWVGIRVTCMKGADIPHHSIVAACAVLTKRYDEPFCVLAGVPAKIVKRGVDWSMVRIPVGDIPQGYVSPVNQEWKERDYR